MENTRASWAQPEPFGTMAQVKGESEGFEVAGRFAGMSTNKTARAAGALYLLIAVSAGLAAFPFAVALASMRAPALVSYAVDFAALAATFAVTLSLLIAGSRDGKADGRGGLVSRLEELWRFSFWWGS